MSKQYKTGLIASAFDIIHPGYIRLIKDAHKICDYLILALHKDPSLENPEKAKPVFHHRTRLEILRSLKNVDHVFFYATEAGLAELIEKHADVHITGSDHKDDPPFHSKPMYFHERDHDWSATKYKKMIRESHD